MVRDTDLDWQLISARDPFYGVLTNERYLTENLTPGAVEEFYESGRIDVGHTVDTLRGLSGGDFAPDVALDFGCGVGRLTFAMAEYANRVIGVDVAEPMLEVGRQQATQRRVGNVELRTDLPDGGVDWVNSVIVFQHIPPDRGQQLFDDLVGRLRPGGYVSLQLTFFRDRRHTGEVERDLGDYRYDGKVVQLLSPPGADGAGGMSMYDYDLNRVFRTLFTAGVERLGVDHTDHGGCHGVMLHGRKRLDALELTAGAPEPATTAGVPSTTPAALARLRRLRRRLRLRG
jgi:SAM-dependent methyltransferase